MRKIRKFTTIEKLKVTLLIVFVFVVSPMYLAIKELRSLGEAVPFSYYLIITLFLVIIIMLIVDLAFPDKHFSQKLLSKVWIKLSKLFGVKYEKKLTEILDVLRYYSTDRIMRDEREFETGIYEYLKSKLPRMKIKHQHKVRMGRIDIIVGGDTAIELKIADNRGNLDSLFAQIEWYKEEFNNLIIVIVDLGLVNSINEYKKRFEKKGAIVIILKNIRVSRY